MSAFFSSFNGVEVFFLICAIIGGTFQLIRIVMMFIGFGHDFASDIGSGEHHIDASHSDSDIGFKLLSIHGLTSFLLMFGLVGLALYRQSKTGMTIAMIGAIVAGFASVWIIGKLFSSISKLQSSGTISIDNSVGAEGKVYLTIPENGTGRVLVNVRNSLREYDASSHDTKENLTGTPIRVIWVDGNVLVVERI